MGVVYVAQHPRLPRRVALKLLQTELGADPSFLVRFRREAETVARLDHRNIVAIDDSGAENGALWISMGFIDGRTSGAALADYECGMPPSRAVHIIEGVAAALDFAHRHNVIHRDVKPANIVLTASDDGDDEHVYLTDFGVAKAMAWNPVKPEQLAITSGTSKNPPADLRIADLKGKRNAEAGHRFAGYRRSVVFAQRHACGLLASKTAGAGGGQPYIQNVSGSAPVAITAAGVQRRRPGLEPLTADHRHGGDQHDDRPGLRPGCVLVDRIGERKQSDSHEDRNNTCCRLLRRPGRAYGPQACGARQQGLDPIESAVQRRDIGVSGVLFLGFQRQDQLPTRL